MWFDLSSAYSRFHTQTKTGIGSIDTEAEGHKLNGHVAPHREPAKKKQSQQMNFSKGSSSGGGFLQYLMWIAVVGVIVIGGFMVKAYLDKKKKQDRFSF